MNLFVFLFSFCCLVSAKWIQRGYNAERSNQPLYESGVALSVSPYQTWNKDITANFSSDPVVDANIFYYSSTGSDLVAAHIENGSTIWRINFNFSFTSHFTLDISNSLIYSYANNSTLYAFSTTNGAIVWNKTWNGTTLLDSPILTGTSLIVIGSIMEQSNLFVTSIQIFSGKPSISWSCTFPSTKPFLTGGAVVSPNGIVYAFGCDSITVCSLYAISSGTQRWKYIRTDVHFTDAKVRKDHTIVLNTNVNTILLTDSGSMPILQKEIPFHVMALINNQMVGSSVNSNALWLLDSMGTALQQWSPFEAAQILGVSIDPSDVIYVIWNAYGEASAISGLRSNSLSFRWNFGYNSKALAKVNPIIVGDGSLIVKGTGKLFRLDCCGVHGTCSSGECECKSNYYGSTCSQYCNDTICKMKMNGHASCSSFGVCTCDYNYYPPSTCSTYCDYDTCNRKGYCTTDGTCSCNSYYVGANCSIYCNSIYGSFINGKCVCSKGHYGTGCDFICDCIYGTCMEDGSCVCDRSNSWLGIGNYYGRYCNQAEAPTGLLLLIFGVLLILCCWFFGGCLLWKKMPNGYWSVSQHEDELEKM